MAKSKLHAGHNEAISAKRKFDSQKGAHRPQKKARLLLESDGSDEDTTSPPGGVAVANGTNVDDINAFQVNQEFARRFEHNKEREELHRCMIRDPFIVGYLLIQHSRGKVRQGSTARRDPCITG